MNKWKIAFWICFTVLLFTITFGLYSIVDQGVSLTHISDRFSKTKSDLNDIRHILNDTNLEKNNVKEVLEKRSDFEYLELDKNSICLQTVTLIFQNDKLVTIKSIK